MKYFVYLVKCSDGTYYCGYTNDLDKRIREHNSGDYGAKYTKGRRPVKLIYNEKYEDRSSALKREVEIKNLKRSEKEKLFSVQVQKNEPR